MKKLATINSGNFHVIKILMKEKRVHALKKFQEFDRDYSNPQNSRRLHEFFSILKFFVTAFYSKFKHP